MFRLGLEEALKQKPKTMTFLERIRRIYMRQIERADRKKLLDLFTFFQSKESEAIIHERLLREAKPLLPHLITDELLAHKTRSIIFWRGLKEECERRLRYE